jgi:hypothetical protein
MTDRTAPGHVYQPQLGTGIEWKPDEVALWIGGQVMETAKHQTASPYDYWHTLAFAESFPDVTHWWFRSAWTQRVRLSGIQGTLGGGAIWGYMQFIDEETPAGSWSMLEGERPEIFIPYPPNEVQLVNLPLRLALARLVAGVVSDQVQPDTWHIVTSLVPRDELAQAFPEILEVLPWQLEGIRGTIRQEFCTLQGLKSSSLISKV